MKYLLLFFLPLFLFADLESKINANAQTACYLKNPDNGLSPSDYSPSIIGQTLRNSTEHDFSSPGEACSQFNLDPYVTVDTEVYKVIATMSCTVTERTEDGLGDSQETIYHEKEDIYLLDIECNAKCELPRKPDGTLYKKTTDVQESDCTTPKMDLLIKELYGDGYTVDDAKFLTCNSNPSLNACYFYYHVDFGDNNTDNNNTDNNISNSNLTDTNHKLDTLNNNAVQLGEKLNNNGQKLDNIGMKIEQVGTKLDNNGLKIDTLTSSVIDNGNYIGTKIDNMNSNLDNKLDTLHEDLTNSPDYTNILNSIDGSIKDMNEYMKSGESNTEATDSMNDAKNQAQSTVNSITSSLNQIISSYTGTAPIVTGTGKHIFTANVYDGSVTFDLSMFEKLRSSFDIFWLLLLAYLNFKIYSVIIRDLLKKI